MHLTTNIKFVDYVWNVMAHAQKPDFVFRRNGRVHLNRQGRQFSRLLAAEVFASAVVMLYTRSSEVVWRVLATHSIRQFPLHFPSRSSPCPITFQLDSTVSSQFPFRAYVCYCTLLKQSVYRDSQSSPTHLQVSEHWIYYVFRAATAKLSYCVFAQFSRCICSCKQNKLKNICRS